MRPRAFWLTLQPCLVTCWGSLGHRTVAYLAQIQLPVATQLLLPSLTGYEDFSDAAIWADEVVKDPLYSHTAAWHYINVHDSPPEHCNVSVGSAFTTANILTALVNQTTIAAHHDQSHRRMEAYRYVAHLVGDLHQPLHVEGLGRGGNDIPVVFEEANTTLHVVWDVHMIEKYRRGHGDTEREAAKVWAKELAHRDPDTCNIGNASECFLAWAKQSNANVCKHVLPDGLDSIRGRELSGAYYDRNIAVVEDLIYLAGTRLARLLKTIQDDALQHTSLQQMPLFYI